MNNREMGTALANIIGIRTLAVLALVLALAFFVAVPRIEGQGGTPPEPPNTFYGKLKDQTGANVAGGSLVAVVLGSGVDGSGITCGAADPLEFEGDSVYVVDVVESGQVSGCGADGKSVLFSFTPDGGTPHLLKSGPNHLFTWDRADSIHEVDMSVQPNNLFEGWNSLVWLGRALEKPEIEDVLTDVVGPGPWLALARFDSNNVAWLQFFYQAPLDSFNTLVRVDLGLAYWLFVTDGATIAYPLP